MNQTRSKEEEKERKRDRGQEADGKRYCPAKQNTSEELKQGLPRLLGTAKDNKAGRERLTFPSHNVTMHMPPILIIGKSKD